MAKVGIPDEKAEEQLQKGSQYPSKKRQKIQRTAKEGYTKIPCHCH
jgi:hypothetical protein